jgi:hypothetical protein
MIQNLSELQAFTRQRAQRAERIPSRRHKTILESPGCSEQECDYLRSVLPGLPESYIDCIRQLDLNGAITGYFRWSPSVLPNGSLAANLIDANTSAHHPWIPFFQHYGLYLFAAFEGDPIGIARSEVGQAGGGVFRVLRLGPIPEIRPFADSFEACLLLAGNLTAARDRYDGVGDGRDAVQTFLGMLPHFQLSDKATAEWKTIGKVVLLD